MTPRGALAGVLGGAAVLSAVLAATPLMSRTTFALLAPQQAVIPLEKPSESDRDKGEPEASSAEGSVEATGEGAEQPGGAAATDQPNPGQQVAEEPPQPQQLAEEDLDLGICLGRLAAFGTVFERGRPASEEGGACGIVNPVRVTEIVPGVTLSPQGIMRCETAAALAEWVSRFVLPASALLPGRGRLVEVTQGSAYICRGINNAPDADLSEHAFGNAVDVMAFRFSDGPPIPVQPREREGTEAEAFQRAVRAAACLSFTTVLGPGEHQHDDHLHLDVKARDSGYRLCQ